MSDIEALLQQLSSESADERNRAALDLMDIGDPIAIGPLISAINKASNINQRGTLVYALSEFDCVGLLCFLMDLVLHGNFEVSVTAIGIIESQQFSKPEFEEAKIKLASVDVNKLSDTHNEQGYDDLLDFLLQHKNTDN